MKDELGRFGQKMPKHLKQPLADQPTNNASALENAKGRRHISFKLRIHSIGQKNKQVLKSFQKK